MKKVFNKLNKLYKMHYHSLILKQVLKKLKFSNFKIKVLIIKNINKLSKKEIIRSLK